jgi:hypothetical protein
LPAAETKTYHETSTPRALSEWKDSQDGKVSVCFAVDKTTFGAEEKITVRCAIKNLSDKPLTILRPFGDPFYAHSSGFTILGPDGAISYRGPMKEYMLGTASFLELPAHTVVDETIELPADVFPGLRKVGLYTIGYQFMSGCYPKDPPPANFWGGKIKATSLTILVK